MDLPTPTHKYLTRCARVKTVKNIISEKEKVRKDGILVNRFLFDFPGPDLAFASILSSLIFDFL